LRCPTPGTAPTHPSSRRRSDASAARVEACHRFARCKRRFRPPLRPDNLHNTDCDLPARVVPIRLLVGIAEDALDDLANREQGNALVTGFCVQAWRVPEQEHVSVLPLLILEHKQTAARGRPSERDVKFPNGAVDVIDHGGIVTRGISCGCDKQWVVSAWRG
jgi:hypothetical protein